VKRSGCPPCFNSQRGRALYVAVHPARVVAGAPTIRNSEAGPGVFERMRFVQLDGIASPAWMGGVSVRPDRAVTVHYVARTRQPHDGDAARRMGPVGRDDHICPGPVNTGCRARRCWARLAAFSHFLAKKPDPATGSRGRNRIDQRYAGSLRLNASYVFFMADTLMFIH
jgi:hypothetical protein